jgi:CheY-like chemotaxis protein
VVEDVIANQALMKAFLNIFGCGTDIANNGQEAIEKIKTNSYDMCLMDVQMPVMGGIEATEIIRREISKDIPIIALTAAAMKEDKDKCMECGMNDYLTKPIDKKKLKEIISKWKKA